MAKRPAVAKLDASTVDILNVIRKNASSEYRDKIPNITNPVDIPAVGDILYGYPGLANEFIDSLIGRIAFVAIKSATFYNPYANLKKGYLMTGESVEDIFVNIAKVYSFHNDRNDAELELGKETPDVKVAFYAMNWQVQYKVSISDEQLRTAFTSMEGVQDLINRVIEQVYVAEKYDEFLLFKYMFIKAYNKGQLKPVTITPSGTSATNNAAASFRGYSNLMTFPSVNYNDMGVLNGTPRERQCIFMDSLYNATFDVETLASAFNMDRATFFGNLYLMDSWTTFDNDRWAEIRKYGSQVELVTTEELSNMANVKAILVDSEWFQVYDKLLQMSNKYVASKLMWNYFLTSFKIVSTSPFANAIAFVETAQDAPISISATVEGIEKSDVATIVTMKIDGPVHETSLPDTVFSGFPKFVQTDDATSKAIAVHDYGVYIFPNTDTATGTKPELEAQGRAYTADKSIITTPGDGETATAVGDKFTFTES